MCYPKPGPRCSNHARKQLKQALKHKAETNNNPNSTPQQNQHAQQQYEQAHQQWLTTPQGIKHLQKQTQNPLLNTQQKQHAQQQLEKAKTTRQQQLENYKTLQKHPNLQPNDPPGYQTIYTTINGSRLCGTDHPESDHDAMGVYLTPIDQKLGLTKTETSRNTRNIPQNEKSDKNTIEATNYELSEYLRLCLAGNPNVIPTLYSPTTEHLKTPAGKKLLQLRENLISKQLTQKFHGMITSQLKRLEGTGTKMATMPTRPHLIEKYGYDTKYAAVSYRTAIMGRELVETGTLKLPLTRAQEIRDIQQGKYTLEETIQKINDELAKMDEATPTSPLPDHPNREHAQQYLINTYREYYKI